jgi:hypothetical protein
MIEERKKGKSSKFSALLSLSLSYLLCNNQLHNVHTMNITRRKLVLQEDTEEASHKQCSLLDNNQLQV